MADNKNDGKGGPGNPGSGAGPKKPAPIIDLKATVVETTKPAADAVKDAAKAVVEPAKAAAAAATDAAKAASASVSGTTPGTGTPTGASASLSAKAADTKPADAKPATAPAAAKSADPKATVTPPKAMPPAKSGGGFFTHMAAGLTGAILAIGGSQFLDLGLGGPNPEVTKRLAALEQAAAKASPDQVQKLSAAEARIVKLEEAAQSLAAGQVKVATEAKQIEERLTAQKPAASPDAERVARLEEQLAMMAAAATADPRNAGRLQQLAELTGKMREIETRTSQLRTEMTQVIEQRVSRSSEQSEAARSLLAQRTQSIEQSVKSITEETASLRSGVDALKVDIDSRLKQTAKPADVASAIAPVAEKMTKLEATMQTVVKGEQDRNATAGNILLSLELANLKRALDRGGKYASELAAVQKLAGGKLDLAVLEKQQSEGVPSLAVLATELSGVAHGMLDAEAEPADATIGDRLLGGLKSVVRVRKVDHAPGDKSTEAVIARMEKSLKEGRLADVIELYKTLPQKVLTEPATKWFGRIEQRAQVDKALTDLDASLKTSLAGGAAPKKGTN